MLLLEVEQKYIIDKFNSSFATQKDKNFIIYGVGKNTEAILENAEGFSFVGLMDQQTEGEIVLGYRVFSKEEVKKLDSSNHIIVIVARDSVVDIIYNRIKDVVLECGINVFDCEGRNLSESLRSFAPHRLEYWNQSFEELCENIREHEVISFDIFDTLLARKVLYPTDVFDVVECKLRRSSVLIPFKDLRVRAEKNLADSFPSIDEIYMEFKRLSKCTDSEAELYKKLEKETDDALIIARESMIKAYDYALKLEKDIYIFSDMYYSSSYLEELLLKRGIRGYKAILVSNEIKASKEEGTAYQLFRTIAEGDTSSVKRILHIGDNRRADCDMAKSHGVDSYQVYSGYELLMASSIRRLLVDVTELNKRLVLGYVVARYFNDPFVINCTNGYIKVDNYTELSLFIAPMMVEFIRWMIRIVEEKEFDYILFPSRDGYLIKELYNNLADSPVENVYFRTSRRAVSVAGIFEDADISRIARRKYNGTFGDFLCKRYGIQVRDGDNPERLVSTENSVDIEKHLAPYWDSIISYADNERKNYLAYMKNVGVYSKKAHKNTAIFDFVSSGTVQYNLSRILNEKLRGLYFATMNLPNSMYTEDTDAIYSAYGNIRSYGNESFLAKYYLILECILTDSKDTFICIDNQGNEIYEGDGRNHQFGEISKIQCAIMDFARDFKTLFGDVYICADVDLSISDELFGVLFSNGIIVADSIKEVFSGDDIYDGISQYRVWR